MVFLVYEATFTVKGDTYYYVGKTGESLQARRKWHLDSPVRWLEGLDGGSLRLRRLGSFSGEVTALAEEALETARLMEKRGTDAVRGGPWCMAKLSRTLLEEIELVRSLGSARKVMSHAAVGSNLRKHLENTPWNAKRSPRSCSGAGRRGGAVKKKKKPSGAEQRRNRGLVYGQRGFHANKWGTSPDSAEADAQRRYNATRPNRASGSRA